MLMHQVEECKAGSLEEENACRTLWLAMKAINRLGTCCNTSTPGAVHFSIASSNEMTRTADYIDDMCGFNPYFDVDNETAKCWNNI